MEESGRNYLTGTIMLSRNEDGSSPEEYFIKSVIGEGGSTVCYEATRTLKDGVVETGKLKEFYPVDSVVGNQAWYYSFERLPNGQLVPGAGTIRKFDEMCKDYLSTYKLFRKVKVDNSKNEILKSYIQHGEILYGCTGRTQPAFPKAQFPFTFLKEIMKLRRCATKILLGNTYYSLNSGINIINAMQRSRGDQLNIITISDKEDIIHIGETLQILFDKKYASGYDGNR